MNRNIEMTIEKIISFFIGVFTLGIYNYVETGTHIEMVEEDDYVLKIKKATYSEFKESFDLVKWDRYNRSYPDSLFINDHSSYYHANIIRFGSVGYVLTTFGLIKARRHARKKINELKYIK